MRPVCVSCKVEMVAIKNGVPLIHFMEHPDPATPAYEDHDKVRIVNVDVLLEGSWKDGAIDWVCMSDKYQCPECKNEILTGYGKLQFGYEFKDQKKMETYLHEQSVQGKAVVLKKQR
jgi:hypothetical protein